MKYKHTILSTAGLPEAQILELEQAGIFCEQIPFISIQQSVTESLRSLIDTAAQQQKSVVFTSVNAVVAVITQLAGRIPDWQLFCISGATRDASAQYFGAGKIAGSADHAVALAQNISAQERVGEVLFFCGNKRLDTLPVLLAEQGLAVRECIVYTTTLTPVSVDKNYEAILFFSPSGVDSYLSENEVAPDAVLFSIGHTTAKALKSRVPNQVIISPKPGKRQLIETVITYYKG